MYDNETNFVLDMGTGRHICERCGQALTASELAAAFDAAKANIDTAGISDGVAVQTKGVACITQKCREGC